MDNNGSSPSMRPVGKEKGLYEKFSQDIKETHFRAKESQNFLNEIKSYCCIQ